MVQLQMCARTRWQNCWLPSNIHNVWVRCFSQWCTCYQGWVDSPFLIFAYISWTFNDSLVNFSSSIKLFFLFTYMHIPIMIFHSPFYNVVPRLPNFSLDVDCIVEVVEQENPKCIFLTSPNNPDGRYIFVIHKWRNYYSIGCCTDYHILLNYFDSICSV